MGIDELVELCEPMRQTLREEWEAKCVPQAMQQDAFEYGLEASSKNRGTKSSIEVYERAARAYIAEYYPQVANFDRDFLGSLGIVGWE